MIQHSYLTDGVGFFEEEEPVNKFDLFIAFSDLLEPFSNFVHRGL